MWRQGLRSLWAVPHSAHVHVLVLIDLFLSVIGWFWTFPTSGIIILPVSSAFPHVQLSLSAWVVGQWSLTSFCGWLGSILSVHLSDGYVGYLYH